MGALGGVSAVGFATFLLWQARVGSPTVFNDTSRYASVARHPVLSRAFLAGVRPPLVPLVWKLSGSADSFVLVQTCIAIVAWTSLAWLVSRTVRGGWIGLVAGVAVLAFAISRPIMQWNRSVLSESLALSGLAVLFAAAMWWAARPTAGRAVVLGAAGLMFAFARDSDIWVVALLAIALAVYAVVRRETTPRGAWFGIGVLATVAALAFVGSVASDRGHLNLVTVLAARVFPYHDRVDWWADHGMPQARAIEAAARKDSCECSDAPVMSWRVLSQPRFHALDTWIRNHGLRVYVEWLATHPDYVFIEPFRRPERAGFSTYRLSDYAASDRTDAPVVTAVLYPPWPVVVVEIAVVMVAVVLWRRRSRTVAILAALGGLGLIHMLIAWHGDGQESRRHALEGNAQVRLAAMLLLLLCVIAPLARRQSA
jgi:hypothetical protein